MSQMRFTGEEMSQVKFLLSLTSTTDPTSAAVLKKAYKNAKLLPAQLSLFARLGGCDTHWTSRFIKFLSLPSPVTAQELMARGIKGPALGQALLAADAEQFSALA